VTNDAQEDLTRLLKSAADGDHGQLDSLMAVVYDDLRALARRHLARERADHTLQPTALVHEVYMRLIDQRAVDPADRARFFALAARMIRRILVDHARAKRRSKRGGGAPKLELEAALLTVDRDDHVLAVDEALKDLAGLNERLAKIVELRFFGGLSVKETADTLGVSSSTVEKDWRFSSSWLKERLRG
jgi:RNA polymerase sigma factor (TIGR02999 family)